MWAIFIRSLRFKEIPLVVLPKANQQFNFKNKSLCHMETTAAKCVLGQIRNDSMYRLMSNDL